MPKMNNVNGVLLALAAVGAMAVPSFVQAGAKPRRGGRNQERWTSSSWEVVHGTILEDMVEEHDAEEGEEASPEYRLYHVTTAATAVLQSRLKSRQQLIAQAGAERSYGLGGGVKDEAPDLVSLTITLSGARRIKDALRTTILAAKGKVTPSQAVVACIEWMDFPRSLQRQKETIEEDEEYRAEEEDEEPQDVWRDVCVDFWRSATGMEEDEAGSLLDGIGEWGQETWIRKIKQVARKTDAAMRGEPYGAFYRVTALEQAVINLRQSIEANGGYQDDVSGCQPTIGFTESGKSMARMNEEEVEILAVAVRGMPTEYQPDECEVRFRPDRIKVLGKVR